MIIVSSKTQMWGRYMNCPRTDQCTEGKSVSIVAPDSLSIYYAGIVTGDTSKTPYFCIEEKPDIS